MSTLNFQMKNKTMGSFKEDLFEFIKTYCPDISEDEIDISLDDEPVSIDISHRLELRKKTLQIKVYSLYEQKIDDWYVK